MNSRNSGHRRRKRRNEDSEQRAWVIGLIQLAAFAVLWLVALAATVFAGTVNCTPTAGFTACKRITYSGGDQSFTVPTGITSIQVKAWGGAGGGANSAWYLYQAGGAGGGFAQGTIAVTAGQVMTVVVGQGGIPNSLVSTYGGGGAGGEGANSTARGASGGGYSGIFAPGGKTAANARIIAAGGGGASPGSGNPSTGEGGGGGTTGGQDSMPDRSGRGGTQVAGGAAATTDSACNVLPTAGNQFQGGRGGDTSLSNPSEGGGGGGGGYFGGGGGMCQAWQNQAQNGGGGGGASFIAGTGVTVGTTTAGANFIYDGTACSAQIATSGGASDSFYTAGIGQGSCFGTGGSGEVVIQYRIATLRVAKTSVGGVGSFNFSAGNGFGSDSLTTVTAGTQVTGTARPLDNSDTATTVTETIPAGYVVSSISCTGLGSGTATYNLAAGTAALNALATAVNNDITCAYTNTKLPTLRLTKVSNGGVGTFNFSGDNGFGTDAITTITAGTGVNGATKILQNFSTVTTITEAIPSTYFISGLSCAGLGGGSATTNFTAGTVQLNAAATAPGNTITCTYTNTLSNPKLAIVKSASTSGPVALNQIITYTFTVTNTGNRPINSVAVVDTFNGYGTPPVPGNETLTNDAAPTGDSSNGTVNDGIWQTLGVGDTVTFTATYQVRQADIDNLQ